MTHVNVCQGGKLVGALTARVKRLENFPHKGIQNFSNTIYILCVTCWCIIDSFSLTCFLHAAFSSVHSQFVRTFVGLGWAGLIG
jgi:ubiquitin C-terminal hydrolase